MRTSILSRAAVAVATLAIGSVTLAAAPATAATPAGIDRASIVSVLDAARSYQSNGGGYTEAEQAALDKLTETVCGYTTTNDLYPHGAYFNFFKQNSGADGAIVSVELHENIEGGDYTHRYCNFGLVVTADKDAKLSGQATLTLTPRPADTEGPIIANAAADDSTTGQLSGNAFVSTSITRDENEFFSNYSAVDFTAAGAATTSKTVTDQRKIWDHKSKVEKRAAKAKYDKRIAKAKKAYAKALDRAGSNSAKKAAAKKAYLAKRAETKVKYDYAVWNYRYVTNTKTVTQSTPFNLTASGRNNNLG
ncbi:hypothetical protein IFT73_16690 [Aeromicrobium sp. CFBP 8757]|uniref:hypothetical protein n=1 Tax=Aeromicrobium sp. CFBP 8757 TaxID=2775288 RepID=UPI00178505E8|nr:hypothetical protein [Aeromicrobium sp. CFBP 8757]MBD8608496.1 hypothetical protein [Aeromicrobium sp. CFBP 8757]